MRPICECPENFRDSLTTPTAIAQFKWAFVRMDPVNVPAKFEVRTLPVPEIIGGSQNVSGSPSLCLYTPYWPKTPIVLPYRLLLYVHSFCRNFRLEFWVGIANLHSREGNVWVENGTVPNSVGEFLYCSSSSPYTFLYQNSFARSFRLQFWVGAAKPNLGEDEAVEGRG